jgi:UDP-GlcNAc:undecaprenyl-phosphate/decaprenyl-phosphate GlcNAc-1-phosphate transferase
MDKYLPLILISFLAAFLATPLAGRVAHKTGFVDEPKPHKVHIRPIPLLGGLAIYLALAVALGVALLQTSYNIFLPELLAIGGGATLLVLVGLWDDRKGMAPRVKLFAQCTAAVLLVLAGIKVNLFPWEWLNISITLIWVIGITNAINLMDNMDGLAAGVAAVAALIFTLLASAAHQGLIAGLASAVAGASLGFLYYNVSPAMVFMGDTGSLLLGFLLAVIGIKYSPQTLPLGSTWMVPIVVLGLPIFDTTLVTYARLRSRRPVSQGGTDHTSHRLARLGLGSNRSVLTMYLVAGVLGSVALLMTQTTPLASTILFAGLLFVGAVGVLWLGEKRALPPANPAILIFLEDDQGIPAVRAARRISSNVHILLSAGCANELSDQLLEEMALKTEAFHAWRAKAGALAIGPMEYWPEVFQLAGTIHRLQDIPSERLDTMMREARAIIRCRGGEWPASVEDVLQRVRKKTVFAPDIAEMSVLPAVWNNPARLSEWLEDVMMGISKNGVNA